MTTLLTPRRNLPASDTKHEAVLEYHLASDRAVTLEQQSTRGDSTGRSLWLGAQVMTAYLDYLAAKSKPFKVVQGVKVRKRAIELGAGTGQSS